MNAPTRPSIHLCILQPPGYVHAMALLDAALYFRYQFEQLGAEVTVAKNRLRAEAPNLVFGGHLGFDANLARSFCCLFVNLEQLGEGGSRMPPAYLELLRTSHVIDYDGANLPSYARPGGDVPLVSFGFAPYLAPAEPIVPLANRPFDLLFFGSMNARRKQIIDRIEATGRTVVTFDAPVYGPERDAFIRQSRAVLNCHHYDSAVFEQVRAFQVLSLGTPLVSERTARTRPGSAFEDAVNWFDTASLERFFGTEFGLPQFAQRFEGQLQAFRGVDPRAQYAPVLELAQRAYAAARATVRAPVVAQRLVHIGSGKDYRTGWLNVDIQQSAQPDILLDLSKPLTWPVVAPSPFWGRVELQPGATDLIFANNVLEHVPDLPTLMRNCLDLLRDGGLMVIEVPYEHSTGAWQDPTHVRAMNENSWLYYTDWFWYLGWFEHRFKIRESKWLDARLQPCEKAAGAFMSVTLEKVPTTIAERMTARTMRPDFGGLLSAPAAPAAAAARRGAAPVPAMLAVGAAPAASPAPRAGAKPAKLLIAVTFHYVEERLAYLRKTVESFRHLGEAVEAVIVTNTEVAEEREKIVRAVEGQGFAFRLATPTLLGHPFLLTWCHLNVFRAAFAADPAITHFLYLEDDIAFGPQNMEYWLEGRERLRPLNLVASFMRFERRDGVGPACSTDITEPVNPFGIPSIDCPGQYVFLNIAAPYQGMYLLDRELMQEHLSGPSSNPDFGIWQIREKAAQGITFLNVPKGFTSRNLVGYDVAAGQVDPRCLIHHLPNNYANNPQTKFGKVAVSELVRPAYRMQALQAQSA